MIDKAGFELAAIGELESFDAQDEGARTGGDGLLAPLYRLLLGRDDAPPEESRPTRRRRRRRAIRTRARPSAAWYVPAGSRKAIVAATAPVRAGDELLGASCSSRRATRSSRSRTARSRAW